ncbi:2-oxoglutarate ferredoxin oxidoreductase subunit alpha [Siminovitchia terrae]|uniref:2-oxoacid:acceptor oxidoreductase subunit alpha n=1 Tax=Siminovitchia terrae TaxID=1914933 RepID=A0A429XCU1_SIMTE|nr:2-oxoacid:acceptor oxidoreductase subunit alpha [Siminovitchia terrae]RST61111.1 2-oxoacid:acceptor oxidoreductase subunit alpha [Siminovitchia terrae]GIN90968.1 2-oxoglutarate ferredoxin oxidoreductase subunit alpha [Siminovitchia terrae]
MKAQIAWKVGGQQGEGIESTGEIFSVGLNRLGYFLYGYRHFSSRIKGGHTNNKIRVSTEKVNAVSGDLDILVAFDQETIDLNEHELTEEGIIIADAKFNPTKPENSKAQLYAVPFTEIASELGTSLMKNMVAIGATCAVMNLEVEVFTSVIREIFGRKGEEIVQKNMQAMQEGYLYIKDSLGDSGSSLSLAEADGIRRMFMIGNDAIALGALAAGVRLMPAYPITPASDIMEYLIKKLPKVGGTVIQTEDEIAAVTMAIGSNYTGTRAFTASAGPGLSLMMEAIGLSGMTETPLVVVDTQRGGPSTGLPTKQEQSDLMQMIYGTHGEIPKVVIAPSTAEEAFYDAVEAFNIADEYQCPVILLSDLQLSLAKQTVNPFDLGQVEIRRGKLVQEVEAQEDKSTYFKRFEITEDGISPRVLPGTKDGIHHVTGLEHDEEGRPNEFAPNRKKQMDKRMRKLSNFVEKFPNPIAVHAPHEQADLLLIGFNSTRGAIEEAMELLEKDGVKVNHVHIRLIHPFPADQVRPYIDSAKHVLVLENNATGQLANIIKMNVGYIDKIQSHLRFDGDPFYSEDVYKASREVLEHGYVNI